MFNACVIKSSQTGATSVYKALSAMLEEHVLHGGDDQTSIEYFVHANDGEIL